MRGFNNYILSLILLALAIFPTGSSFSMQNKEQKQLLWEKALTTTQKEIDQNRADDKKQLEIAFQNLEAAILNTNDMEQRNDNIAKWQSTLISTIETATNDVGWGIDIEDQLQIIERLLRIGLINNLKIEVNFEPLEEAMSIYMADLSLIRLLLNYGATITDKAFTLRNKNPEISKALSYHKKLRERALNEPTKELLSEAISNNNPFVVKLIVENMPTLIESSHLALAKMKSPASVPLLNKGLVVKKLEQLKELGGLPSELIQNIEKLVAHNYLN